MEKAFKCCGFDDNKSNHTADTPKGGYMCEQVPGCQAAKQDQINTCQTCQEFIQDKVDYAFNSAGGVGLFFAFTEVYTYLYNRTLLI